MPLSLIWGHFNRTLNSVFYSLEKDVSSCDFGISIILLNVKCEIKKPKMAYSGVCVYSHTPAKWKLGKRELEFCLFCPDMPVCLLTSLWFLTVTSGAHLEALVLVLQIFATDFSATYKLAPTSPSLPCLLLCTSVAQPEVGPVVWQQLSVLVGWLP